MKFYITSSRSNDTSVIKEIRLKNVTRRVQYFKVTTRIDLPPITPINVPS